MIDLRSKIYTAKVLLLKKPEIENKTFTFSSIFWDFALRQEDLLDLQREKFIELNNCTLSKEYIYNYQKARKQFEINYAHGIGLPKSASNNELLSLWENYLTDQFCALVEEAYKKLNQSGHIKIAVKDLEKISKKGCSPFDFVTFTLSINSSKLKEFIDNKIDPFIKDELTLEETLTSEEIKYFDELGYPANLDRTRKLICYGKQKDDFSKAIAKQANEGQPLNNLKINYTEIWEKNNKSSMYYLETALAMEKEGLIEIKDIIEQLPKKAQTVSTEVYLKYPMVINLKVLTGFDRYDKLLYKNNPTLNSIPKSHEDKKIAETNNKKYWIDFKNRFVILNNRYIINEMQFDRYTEHWFEYIFNNPNTTLSLNKIRAATKVDSGRKKDDLHKFLDQINFKGQIRELFFDCNKGAIKLNNPITEETLKNKIINIGKLENEMTQLKQI